MTADLCKELDQEELLIPADGNPSVLIKKPWAGLRFLRSRKRLSLQQIARLGYSGKVNKGKERIH